MLPLVGSAQGGGKNAFIIDQYSNAETKVWVRIAEALYGNPAISWDEVRRRIVSGSDGICLTVLGRQKAKQLYYAVKGEWPRARCRKSGTCWCTDSRKKRF